ncbi:hypothetical protein D3C73_668980 [compost metagenome]
MDLGKGFGFWNTMPTWARSSTGSILRSLMSPPSMSIRPVTRQPGMVSFMRFMVRRKVDLPQPDGPIRAVTVLSGMSRETSNRACLSP